MCTISFKLCPIAIFLNLISSGTSIRAQVLIILCKPNFKDESQQAGFLDT